MLKQLYMDRHHVFVTEVYMGKFLSITLLIWICLGKRRCKGSKGSDKMRHQTQISVDDQNLTS